jgi:hypothetical protein
MADDLKAVRDESTPAPRRVSRYPNTRVMIPGAVDAPQPAGQDPVGAVPGGLAGVEASPFDAGAVGV